MERRWVSEGVSAMVFSASQRACIFGSGRRPGWDYHLPGAVSLRSGASENSLAKCRRNYVGDSMLQGGAWSLCQRENYV